jgi:hypothetical protein
LLTWGFLISRSLLTSVGSLAARILLLRIGMVQLGDMRALGELVDSLGEMNAEAQRRRALK